MKISNANQRGFGTLVILFAVVAVMALTGIGWTVYQHNRTKEASAVTGNNQQATNPEPTQTTPAPSQNIIKIPELGIQITVPDSIKDLTYRISTGKLKDGRESTAAIFSTTSLAAADSSCDTDFGPLGSLAKVDGQYPNDNPNPLDYGQLVKQFPTFFISANYPNAPCSTSKSAGSASAATANNANANADKQALSGSLSTIQALN